MFLINLILFLQGFYVNYANTYSKVILRTHLCKSSLDYSDSKLDLTPLKCSNLDTLSLDLDGIAFKKGVLDRKIIEIELLNEKKVFIMFENKKQRKEFTEFLEKNNVRITKKFRFQYFIILMIPLTSFLIYF